MKRLLIIGPCVVLLSPLATGSKADEQTVVITACRAEQEQFEAVRSVELLGRERLQECQARSVPEAVDHLTGVYLQQTNRGAGAPYIRGLVGPQNLILIDGIRFNTSIFRTGPNQYLALIDPFVLDRLEILRGPSSVLYGNGAMGGVIHGLTPFLSPGCAPEGLSGRLEGRAATADHSRGAGVQLTWMEDSIAMLAGGSFNQFGPMRAGGGVEQPLSDYFSGYWHARIAHRIHPDFLLSATYLGASLQDTGRTDQAGIGDLRFYHNHDHFAYLTLRYDGSSLLKRTRASLSYHRLTETIDRYNCQTGPDGRVSDLDGCFALDPRVITRQRRYHDTVDVLGADVNVGMDLWSGRIRANGGLELYQEFVGSSMQTARADTGFVFVNDARGNFSDGSSYRSLGAFLHADATLLDFGEETGELRVNGGLRFSNFTASASDVPDYGDVDFDYSGLVGTAGLQWLRKGRYTIYATFVQGFRAPNLQESTSAGDTGQKFEVPNPDLRPERSDTFEVGGRLMLEPLEFHVAYFYSLIADAMTWKLVTFQGQTEIDGKPVSTVVNSLEGIYLGSEAGISVRFWLMEISAGLAWMQGDISMPDGTSIPARRIPPLFGTVGVHIEEAERNAFLELQLRFAARQDRLHPQDRTDPRICQTYPFSGELRDPCNGTPGWVTLGVTLGFRITDYTRLYLSMSNMTDENYRNHGSGFDASGIDARFNLVSAF